MSGKQITWKLPIYVETLTFYYPEISNNVFHLRSEFVGNMVFVFIQARGNLPDTAVIGITQW